MSEEKHPEPSEEFMKELYELMKNAFEEVKDYSRFTFLFPLKEEYPLVQEGDLRELYSSKTKTLPELLHEKPFTVSEDVSAEIHKDDLEFIQGMHVVFRTGTAMIPSPPVEGEPSSFADTYLIVNVGHAHLPAVAYKLMQQGVDCSFVIGESTNSRFKEAIKYWAGRYQDIKEAQKEVVGHATMLDAHREERFPEEMFPTPEKLAELGIKRVVYLVEGKASPTPIDLTFNDDTRPVIEKYKASGLDVIAYGIDNRQND